MSSENKIDLSKVKLENHDEMIKFATNFNIIRIMFGHPRLSFSDEPPIEEKEECTCGRNLGRTSVFHAMVCEGFETCICNEIPTSFSNE